MRNSSNRIIYYYQTFVGLHDLLVKKSVVTHIHLSSIHFMKENGQYIIHLNDYQPNNKTFDKVWNDCNKASELGIKIILMIGGEGDAFTKLFNNFNCYYPLLKKLIISKKCIKGVDLDIEESVNLKDVKKLINQLDQDFGKDFIISMAPTQYALENDRPGLGGFVYKDLLKTSEGHRINYFNGQFYNDFSLKSYQSVIRNGYPSNKIVIGMISSQGINFNYILDEITKIKKYYPNFGGIFNWEYCDSPPLGINNPYKWALLVSSYL